MNKPQQFKIQTPVGSIESDSGNHFVDVITVVGVIVLYLIAKKVLGK
tara:strand:+ start:4822 stop:4962 length:141 start_codon:yes stop_codon:yes gene_type:complete